MALDRGVDYDTDSPGCVCPDPENYRQVGGSRKLVVACCDSLPAGLGGAMLYGSGIG